MSVELTALQAQVAKSTATDEALVTAVTSLITLTNTIKTQLDALISAGNPIPAATLNDLSNQLATESAKVAATTQAALAAITADTPVAPPAA